jgi:AcrR family transcriptional regulator
MTTRLGLKRAPADQPRLPPRLPRVSGAARRHAILERAAQLFAERGFAASTRDLAKALGVTQALLYRYFPSKQALIDATVDAAFAVRPNDDAREILAERNIALTVRLTRFYESYLAAGSETRARLWMQCALAGHNLALRTGVRLSETVLAPIAAELRHFAGLPDFAAVPFTHQERELVMILHGGMAFLAIRKHIYRMSMTLKLEALIAQQAQVWALGAINVVGALLAGGRPAAVPLVRRKIVRLP